MLNAALKFDKAKDPNAHTPSTQYRKFTTLKSYIPKAILKIPKTLLSANRLAKTQYEL